MIGQQLGSFRIEALLGVVLYQMLAGTAPFDGNTPAVLMLRHLHEQPPRLSGKVCEIPGALDNFVVRLMAKAPPDRPGNAAEVADVLSQLLGKKSQQPVKKPRPYPLRLRPWRWRFRGELRWIARDDSPGPYPEDTMWDRDLDG